MGSTIGMTGQGEEKDDMGKTEGVRVSREKMSLFGINKRGQTFKLNIAPPLAFTQAL
jgi:hypothetical protein